MAGSLGCSQITFSVSLPMVQSDHGGRLKRRADIQPTKLLMQITSPFIYLSRSKPPESSKVVSIDPRASDALLCTPTNTRCLRLGSRIADFLSTGPSGRRLPRKANVRNTSCCCARPSSVQINDANLKQMLANAPRKGNACMHLCTFKLTQACISGRRSAPQGPNSFPPLLHNSFLVTHHLPLSPPMCNFCIHMYLAAREQSAAHRLYRMGLLRGKHVCS